MTFEPETMDPDEVADLVDETIASSEVALFMKGSELMPQCGYSEKALTLLRQHREDVECVDVLQATEAFRDALERHSGWRTVPQAYVDGEFVGGSDVLEELDERGELAETVNA